MRHLKLIKKAKAGNKEAFEKLLSLYSDRLYRTAYLYAGNREDALDIVQETSYKAFLAIGKLKENTYFLTWLTRILINSAYDLKKKQKKDIPLEYVSDLPSNKNQSTVEHIDLVRAVNGLRDTYRDAIILFYYHDLPIKEISKIMDIPENTVKTYLQRGKKQLKTILEGVGCNEGKAISRKI
ncbi:sigma-70 family RNA polymerase sigma factor [Halobacillus amylolyticus]|uniref:Sigma-70 family RNA polymerase sigma factor n=1 Tax=Halobacillus amylolyticus TaxID=2932259 RepID=A0ABY4HFP9_9BACI|nr:sigma-70 family RNA polymerase sigma factor [Halobacillus amylolyticus]UOR13717.1 sigma-70 family RNA polymerase sigma factor [Halobacillus amylolyticus]